jgi:hypothetical protein
MNIKSFKNFFTCFAILGIIIVMTMALISIWGDISPEFMQRTIATYVIVFFSIRLISICLRNFGSKDK